MPATVQEVGISTRIAQSKLPPRTKPYYRNISDELHVGYFKPATRGDLDPG